MGARDDLLVRLGLDPKEFDKGIANARKSIRDLLAKDVEKTAKSIGKDLKGLGEAAVKLGAVAAAGAAGVLLLARNAAEAALEIQNASRAANAGVEEYQAWSFAARTANIENEKLADILKDVNDRVGDFLSTGGGPMADFFENVAPKIGLTAEAFRNLSGPQALQLYYDSLEKANLNQQQMTFYMEAMASDSTRLIPLLRNGGQELDNQAEAARELGLVLSDLDVAQLAQLATSTGTLEDIARGAAHQFGAALAPYIQVVSDRMTDAARATGGFRAESESAITVALKGFGWLGDVVKAFFTGLFWAYRQWKGLQQGVAEGVLAIAEAMDATRQAFGMEGMGQPLEDLRAQVAAGQTALDDLENQLMDFAGGELPSEWVDQLIADADVARQKMLDQLKNEDYGTGMGTGTGGGPAANDNETERLRTQLEALDDALATKEELEERHYAKRLEQLDAFLAAGLITQQGYDERAMKAEMDRDAALAELRDDGAANRLAALETALMTEEETELAHYEQQLADLQEAIDKGLKTRADAAAMAERIEQQHMDRLREIREKGLSDLEKFNAMSWTNQAQTVLGELTGLTSGVARENKRMFQLNKVAGIANAIVNAYVGISKTMAAYPYPINIGLAAAHAAAAFAQVQSIRSATFGGGGSAPAVGGGGSAAPASTSLPAATAGGATPGGGGVGSGQVVTINIQGDLFPRAAVLKMIDAINDATADGARLRVA